MENMKFLGAAALCLPLSSDLSPFNETEYAYSTDAEVSIYEHVACFKISQSK